MGSGMLMMVLVPAFLMLVMVVLGIVGLREMRRGAQLEARGRRTEGRVISSKLHHSGTGENRSSRLVETIEFVADGRTVRGIPSLNDTGRVDRSGMTVPVIFDPDQPEVFVAPENGERVSRTGPLIKVVVAVVGVLVVGGFVLGPALFLAVLV